MTEPYAGGLENARTLYLQAIRDGDENAIDVYSGDRYTQHSTPVKDGREGFKEFFRDFKSRNPIRDIEIVRSWQDGPYVFLHVLQNLNNGEWKYVTADIFEVDEQGRLIEHWDMIAEMADATLSGRTELDGPTEPTDLASTAVNKALVRDFLDVMAEGRGDRVGEFIAEDYAQHNPAVADGIEGLTAFLSALADAGHSMTYSRIYNVIGCGDFVASLAAMEVAGKEMAVIDLWRVEDGKIVEHWDVMEEITPRDTWVNSGKF